MDSPYPGDVNLKKGDNLHVMLPSVSHPVKVHHDKIEILRHRTSFPKTGSDQSRRRSFEETRRGLFRRADKGRTDNRDGNTRAGCNGGADIDQHITRELKAPKFPTQSRRSSILSPRPMALTRTRRAGLQNPFNRRFSVTLRIMVSLPF